MQGGPSPRQPGLRRTHSPSAAPDKKPAVLRVPACGASRTTRVSPAGAAPFPVSRTGCSTHDETMRPAHQTHEKSRRCRSP
jgi:hypothetical protein